jgi:CMP/dCMP kinase
LSAEFDLRGLLVDLARARSDFVVIGSSSLALQGWTVAPSDLDLMARADNVHPIVRSLGIPEGSGSWVSDGEARRLECVTAKGPVDIYSAVSGGLSFDAVMRHSVPVGLGDSGLSVRVGSLGHVRDMRAAVGRSSLPEEAVAPAGRPGIPRIVAIDGPAGAGKSTVSRGVARRLGFTYLNTGAMYRCVALALLSAQADTDDHEAIARIAASVEIQFRDTKVFLNGVEVSDAIRDETVAAVTAHVAAFPEVRASLVRRQRELFESGGYVAEGRDTGTVVAPEAPLKVFLTAAPEERARRRSRETGKLESSVRGALEARDRADAERKISALRIAEDAVVLDTTELSVQDVVDEIVSLAGERGIV